MKKSIAAKTIALILALTVCFSTLSAVGAAAADQLCEQIAVSDTVEANEETNPETTAESAQTEKPSSAKGFLIGLAAVLLGGGVAGGIIFIKLKKDEE